MTWQCGGWVATLCSKCNAIHTYQRFCKTAGCKTIGCAEARSRLHVRKLMCTDFDTSRELLFITLTSRNSSLEEVDSKQFRTARIHAIKKLLDRLDCSLYIIAHEITVNTERAPTQRYHYHHHLVCQLDEQWDADRDLTAFIHNVWQDEMGQMVDYKHGVNVQCLKMESIDALTQYICKYVSKDAAKNYYPKSMQSFQRCKRLVDREFIYTLEHSVARCMYSEVKDKKIIIKAFGVADDIPLRKIKWSPVGTVPSTVPIRTVLGVNELHRASVHTEVLIRRSTELIIKVDAVKSVKMNFGKPMLNMNGSKKQNADYRIYKECVNCAQQFREDKYRRNAALSFIKIVDVEFNEYCKQSAQYQHVMQNSADTLNHTRKCVKGDGYNCTVVASHSHFTVDT